MCPMILVGQTVAILYELRLRRGKDMPYVTQLFKGTGTLSPYTKSLNFSRISQR